MNYRIYEKLTSGERKHRGIVSGLPNEIHKGDFIDLEGENNLLLVISRTHKAIATGDMLYFETQLLVTEIPRPEE